MPEAYNLKVTRCIYAEEADDVANKVSQRPEAHPAGERKVNKVFYDTGNYCLQGGNLQAKWYHLSKKEWMFPPFFYLIFQ